MPAEEYKVSHIEIGPCEKLEDGRLTCPQCRAILWADEGPAKECGHLLYSEWDSAPDSSYFHPKVAQIREREKQVVTVEDGMDEVDYPSDGELAEKLKCNVSVLRLWDATGSTYIAVADREI